MPQEIGLALIQGVADEDQVKLSTAFYAVCTSALLVAVQPNLAVAS